MDEALAYEHAVRRRLRLQASVALAGQGGAGLSAADAASLTGQLVLAHTAERAMRDGATGALPIDALSRRLELGPLDEDLALVAALLETDAVFALSLAAIAGGDPRHGVSGKLLAQLLGATAEDRDLAAMRPDDNHPLVRAGLLVSIEPPAVTTLRAWRMPPRVAAWLWGRDADDAALRRCGGPVAPPPRPDTVHLAGVLTTAARLLAGDRDDATATALVLRGPAGAGRRLVVALAAAETGRVCVQLDLARASSERGAFEQELAAFWREVWLRDAVPVVANLDALAGGDDAPRLALVTAALDAARGPIALTLTSAAAPTLERRAVELRVDAPDAVARARMWRAALGDAATDGAALDGLAARYALTPALIERAAASAVQLAGTGAPTPAQLQAGVASVIHERFGGLATHVEVRQRWDDLVLPQDTADDVRAFISRAGSAAKVYEQWGFRDKLQRGLGLAALFSGPPGTGKTMVAGLIAKELGLELYMVDLSQVVSKWVGETEKQLGKIFDAAGMGRALLLFDEADALFARRTEVKSSNDRYANLEVNYLLQRLEQFAGVVILTTNLDGSVDPAFKRRMAAEVRFYPPELPERERLWRTLIPAQTPISGTLDFGDLAREFDEMCGGHIRNAVLRAAFLAAAEDSAVTQGHLERAARTEARNMGKIL